MSKPEVIKIDNVEYVRKGSNSIAPPEGDVKIIVADRGFVYVGFVEEGENYTTVREARNIRIWGTTKGLGELVHGPTSKTVLDSVGTVKAPNRAVISIIDVDKKAWKLF